MRLTSERREKIATALAWIFLCVIFVPAWCFEKIARTNFPRIYSKVSNWSDKKINNLSNRIEAWINNTPEGTMEILKRGAIKNDSNDF